MSDDLKFQLRLTLSKEFVRVARNDPTSPSISPLTNILSRHDAALKCQFDAFADYVSEAEANGIENFHRYVVSLARQNRLIPGGLRKTSRRVDRTWRALIAPIFDTAREAKKRKAQFRAEASVRYSARAQRLPTKSLMRSMHESARRTMA